MRSEIVGPGLLFFVFSLQFAFVVLIFNTTRLNTDHEGRLVSKTFWPEFGYNTWANQGPSLDSMHVQSGNEKTVHN